MEFFIHNLSARSRYTTLNGKQYLVAPASIIVPGVLNGSKGALYYPPHEVMASPGAWNNIPLTVNHPFDRFGRHVSANEGDVLERQGIGHTANDRWEDGKRKVDAWFDIDKTRRVDNSILQSLQSGQPVEVSTGLYTENHPAPPGSTYNGRSYDYVATNYRPDHLAILPTQVGACSIKDGCGVLVNAGGLTPVDTGAPPPPASGKPKKIKAPKPVKASLYGSHEASQAVAEMGASIGTADTKATANTSELVDNPFVSEAQRRACYAADDPAWDCSEWEEKTHGKLPKRKKTTENLQWSCEIYEVLTGNQHNGIGLYELLTGNGRPDQPRDDHGRFSTTGEAAKMVGLARDTPWEITHDKMQDLGMSKAAAKVRHIGVTEKAILLSRKADDLTQEGRSVIPSPEIRGGMRRERVFRSQFDPVSSVVQSMTPKEHLELAKEHEFQASRHVHPTASKVRDAHVAAAEAHREAAATPKEPTHNVSGYGIGLYDVLMCNYHNEFVVHGGAGSGNFGHQGRPGEVGGSGGGGGSGGKEVKEKNTTDIIGARIAKAKESLKNARESLTKAKTPKDQAKAQTRIGTIKAKLKQLRQEERDDAKRGGEGSKGVQGGHETSSGQMAKAAGRTGDGGNDKERESVSKPYGSSAAGRVTSSIDQVNDKLDRYEKFFEKSGDKESVTLLQTLREHVNDVGVDTALEGISGGAHEGISGTGKVAYEGWWLDKDPTPGEKYKPGEDDHLRGMSGKGDVTGKTRMGRWAEEYLDRHGIILQPPRGIIREDKPFISSSTPTQGGKPTGRKGDFTPSDPTFKNKLEEAKHLPGLEKSEDINKLLGREVTHLTPDVTKKLDETYGKNKWIVKAYGDEAAAGYGIFFSQRAAQVKLNAKNTLWTAGEYLAKRGYSLDRDDSGKVSGIKSSSGKVYKFGKVTRWEDEDDPETGKKFLKFEHEGAPGYNKLPVNVRRWADKAAEASDHEHGAALPDKGKEFMAQPAFNVVGVSNKERAEGITIQYFNEGRVHVVTRNGKAEVVPHSTLVKGEELPVVFEDKRTRAMAKTAVDTINALPASERQGQIYAPDVIKVKGGWKVVEANPANKVGSSGYLGDNPFIIDAYASHLTGREPAHVQFIRSVLTEKRGSRMKPTGNADREYARDDHGRFASTGEAAESVGLKKDTPWQIVHDEMLERGISKGASRVKYLGMPPNPHLSAAAVKLSKEANEVHSMQGLIKTGSTMRPSARPGSPEFKAQMAERKAKASAPLTREDHDNKATDHERMAKLLETSAAERMDQRIREMNAGGGFEGHLLTSTGHHEPENERNQRIEGQWRHRDAAVAHRKAASSYDSSTINRRHSTRRISPTVNHNHDPYYE